jgi:hypothetical protein
MMSENSGDKKYADNMIKRIVTDAQDPRDFIDLALLRMRTLHSIEPSAGGRFGVSLAFLAKLEFPISGVLQREFIKKISSSPGSLPGENMRRLRYAMEVIGLTTLPVVDEIDRVHPDWQVDNFTPVESSYDLICGAGRKGHGFLFASQERTGALLMVKIYKEKNQDKADSTSRSVHAFGRHLQLVIPPSTPSLPPPSENVA